MRAKPVLVVKPKPDGEMEYICISCYDDNPRKPIFIGETCMSCVDENPNTPIYDTTTRKCVSC